MANPLRFHPLVVEDLKAATDWYDGIEIVLGNRFRQSVNERLDSVELFPESYVIVRGTLRVALVNGFPYLMIFEWTSDSTEIVGIFFILPRTQPSGSEVRVDLMSLPIRTRS